MAVNQKLNKEISFPPGESCRRGIEVEIEGRRGPYENYPNSLDRAFAIRIQDFELAYRDRALNWQFFVCFEKVSVCTNEESK